MKRVLEDRTDNTAEMDEKRRNLNEMFKTKPLSELVQLTRPKVIKPWHFRKDV